MRLRYALAGLTLMLSCRPVAVSVGDGVGVGVAVERAAAGLTIYPRVGDAGDAQPALAGPALILMGGGSDVDDAFRWAQTVIGEGDVVVLRASGGDGYDAYLAGLAPFHSVQTVKLEPPASADALAQAAAIVERAELVFFAGGDQADYVAWRGSPLLAAVQGVWARGGVVGGTSAGCAILGQLVFDDVAAALANVNVDGLRALADPWDGAISFSRDLFAFAPMAGVITDTHFAARDRMARLAAFVARLQAEGAAPSVLGLGIDEGNALVVEANGTATLLQQRAGEGGAWAVALTSPSTATRGRPLAASGLEVTRLDRAGQQLDLRARCGGGTRYAISVDGARPLQPYTPRDPYGASGLPTPACPPPPAPTDGGTHDAAPPSSPPAPDAAPTLPPPFDAPPPRAPAGCSFTGF